MSELTLDTVYPVLVSENHVTGGIPKRAYPSVEVSGGTVNVYMSNMDTLPTGQAQMTLYQGSPLSIGVHGLGASPRWILFSSDSGSPVVRENEIVRS